MTTSAPVRTRPSPPPKPAAPATGVELGNLAARVETSEKKVAELTDKLTRIEQGLKTPNLSKEQVHDLKELRTKYQAELKAENPKLDGARRQLDAAFKQIEGGGAARDGVGKLWARKAGLDKEENAALAARDTATKNLTAAIAAYQAAMDKKPRSLAAIGAADKKATAAKKALETANANLEAFGPARAALGKELAAREVVAFADAKKANDPSVKDVADLTDLASNRREQQVKAIGGPVVIGRDAAVKADVARIDLAAKRAPYRDDGAANAARMLQTQLDGSAPDYHDALMQAAKPQLAEMGKYAELRETAANPVIDAFAKVDGTAKSTMALELAKATTKGMDSEVIKSLSSRMKNGDNFDEAYALMRGLTAAGKPELAQQVDALISSRIKELTADFKDKAGDAAGAKADLARLVGGFGPLLDPSKQKAAIDEFKSRHKDEFANFEAAGGKLARAAKFITAHAAYAGDAPDLLPEALTTKEGERQIVAALNDSSLGKSTFLSQIKDGTKAAKYVPALVVKAAGQHALNLVAQGKGSEASRFIGKLSEHPALFQMNDKTLATVAGKLADVIDGKEGAVKALGTEMKKMKADTSVTTAFRGIAWGASILQGINRFGGDDKSVYNHVKAAGEILQPTAEMAAFALEGVVKSKEAQYALLAKVDKNAPFTVAKAGQVARATDVMNLAKGLGGAFQAVGAVLEGVSAWQSFEKGEYVDSGLSAASALGGGVLALDAMAAAAGMQVVPVWGQVAGAALVIGSIVGKLTYGEYKEAKKEKRAENDAQAYLKASGITDPKKANELSDLKRADGRNVGMMVQQLAPALGMKPKELWDKLVAMDSDSIDKFVNMTKDLVLDKDGRVAPKKRDATDVDYIEKKRVRTGDKAGDFTNVYYRPQSLETAVAWTKKFLAGQV